MSKTFAELPASTLSGNAATTLVPIWEDGQTRQASLSTLANSLGTSPVIGNSDIPIALYGNKMAEGTSVSIYVFGDSTHFGYLQGNTQASPTPVATFQAALRSYYNNTAVSVINKSVSGMGVNYGLSIIDAELAAMPAAAVVRISYMTNNATGLVGSETMLADEYAVKLRELVRRVRASRRLVEFETGLPILPYGDFGTQVRAERAKQFAETMRAVGRELGVPTQDTYSYFERMLDVFADSSLLFSDGIHLTQLGYNLRGYWMANTYMRAPVMPFSGIIPAVNSSFRHYGGSNNIFAATGSVTGRGRVAANLRIPIEVQQPGTDIYLATPIWSLGSNSVTIKGNGVTLWTGSLQAAALTTPFAVDHELMVLENASPGIYLFEMSAAELDCGLYYVLSRPTRRQSLVFSGGVVPTGTALRSEGELTLVTNAGSTATNHVLSDISASSALRPLTVEVTAKFGSNQGLIIHGIRLSSASAWSGVLVYVDGTNGYLAAATGTNGSYSSAVLGNTDLRTAEHVYRAEVALNGDVGIYVDGTLIGTYTPTISYRGGRIGAYAYGGGVTVTLKNIKVGNK